MESSSSRPELLVIVGETASGKSSLAMKVAKEFNGEIIAADSWTVYKGFDIGTSKPTKEEQKQIKHHLLDVADAEDGFNAPKFKELAEKAIKDIQNRGKLPIMAGGTGLYIDSVLFDFGFLPDVSVEQRKTLNALAISELIELAKTQLVDLTDVDSRNKRRIIRAIEAKGEKPTKRGLRKRTLIVGLQVPREELRNLIEQRTEQMVVDGLEHEVKELASNYGWDVEPMKGIGYQQWRDYFEDRKTLEQTMQRIVSATMGLAKRQRTWFKRNRAINWFNNQNEAFEYVKNQLPNN